MSTTLSSLHSKLAMSMSFSIVRATILICCLALCSSSCTITCTENITDFYNSGFVTVIEEDSNYTGPMNTIGYVSNNVTFSASVPLSCHLRLYQNTCRCSNLDNVILHINGTNYLRYTILNLTLSYDEMRIDICAQCGNDFKCFRPVYLIVKDVPILSFNNVLATVTCNGIMVAGYIDNDIELLLILKDSFNNIVFSETVRTLPHLINSTVLHPGSEYAITFIASNLAGYSNSIEKNVSLFNLFRFKITTREVVYVNDTPQVIINVTTSCPLSVQLPLLFHLKSNCIKGGYTNVTVNDDNEAITVKLLDELKVCKIIMSLEGKHDTSQATTFNINPANVTIYPHETSDGYFRTIVTLLRGVTGLVVQVINANGSMQFKQHINRSGSIRSTTRLPRGNYTVNIYQEMKNGLRPIKIGIPLQCIMKEEIDNDNTSTTFNEPQKALQWWIYLLIAIGTIILIAPTVVGIIAVPLKLYKKYRRDHQTGQLPQSETNDVELQNFKNDVEGGHPSKEDDHEETEVKDEVRKVASVGRNFSKPETDTGTPQLQHQHQRNYNPTMEPNESSITDSPDNSAQPLLSKDDELKHQTSHTTLPRQPSKLTVSHRSNSTALPIAPPTTHPTPHPTTQPTHSGTGQSSVPSETDSLLPRNDGNNGHEYLSSDVRVNVQTTDSNLVVACPSVLTQAEDTPGMTKPIPETQAPSYTKEPVQPQQPDSSSDITVVGLRGGSNGNSLFLLPPTALQRQFSRSISHESQPQNQIMGDDKIDNVTATTPNNPNDLKAGGVSDQEDNTPGGK